MKPIVKIFLLLFIPIITALCTFLILYTLLLSPYDSKSTENKLIIVTSNLKETGKLLESNQIIKHWWSFYTVAKLRSLKNSITTGEYEFSPSMTPLNIVKKINNGDLKIREIAITPGDTIVQIINKFESADVASREEIEKKFYDKKYIQSLGIPNGNLEGFLFPSRYSFSKPITIDSLLKRILQEGDRHWLPTFNEQTAFLRMDKVKVITLASVIERECLERNIFKDQATFRNISAVYHNRLKRGMPLNAESTIYYVYPNAHHPLEEKDKRRYSPFNTFINIGLPPTPIGAPSYEAIKAALYPASERYINFIFDEQNRRLTFENETIPLPKKQ